MKDRRYWLKRFTRWLGGLERWVVGYFVNNPPTLRYSLPPLLLMAVLLYVRHPATNYIFDEQEALLANPYVNAIGGLKFSDVIYRDFWGLPPDGSIGSYRPIPNVIWRATWFVSKHPFVHHLYNLVLHGLNGALLASFAHAVTKRRGLGWLVGAIFVASAIITEAVSGIVGIADVLGGLGAVLALCALRLPAATMPLAVFAAVTFGLFSKESALVCVPLVPAAALLTAHVLHPQRPARWLRTLLAFTAAAAAFILYVELRKDWFPSPLPSELSAPLPAEAGALKQLFHDFMVWFHQAPLPRDPLNNPLAHEDVDFPHRVAGALRVWWRGLCQVVLPLHLSGDYSFPQEPAPKHLFGWETVAGAIAMVGGLALSLALMLVGWLRVLTDRKRLLPSGELSAAVAALFDGGAAVTAGPLSRRARAIVEPPLVMPTRRPWHRNKLAAAIIVMAAALAALVTEFVMLRGGGPSWVRTWPFMVALLLVGVGLLIDGWVGKRKPMQAAGPWPWRHVTTVVLPLGMVWTVVSYFPHSNIPVLLPTVRAERFWYFPVMGTALVLALVLAFVADRLRDWQVGWRSARLSVPALFIGVFLSVQCLQAYRHSMDYRDDLVFWRATKDAVPNSSKAHLNYSVMVGARGDLETRLYESKIAMRLAPKWPMAHIYTGDTLCRLHRADEAWPHYAHGFDIGKNERSLIALALQCMYDEKVLTHYDKELRALADKHPGSWIAYLAVDTLDNHERHQGVDPQYRPRGYNEGPKEDKTSEESAETTETSDVEVVEEDGFGGGDPDEEDGFGGGDPDEEDGFGGGDPDDPEG